MAPASDLMAPMPAVTTGSTIVEYAMFSVEPDLTKNRETSGSPGPKAPLRKNSQPSNESVAAEPSVAPAGPGEPLKLP